LQLQQQCRVVEGNTVGHVPQEKYQESAGTFWRGTITCKVTDKQQHSNIPGKELDVPCMWLTTGTEPIQVEKLIRIFRSCHSDF